MTERVLRRSYLVHVDSADRDAARYPLSNDFSVRLGNSDTAGLLRPFVDVAAVELVSVIIPQRTAGGDCVDDHPYVLLEIPELGSNFQATNMAATRAFAKLRFDNDLGAYREYRTNAYERFRKDFHALRSIDRLTFRFYRPDGEPYDFGTGVLLRSRYARVTTTTADTTTTVPMYFDGEHWYRVPEAGNGGGGGGGGGGGSGGGGGTACAPAPGGGAGNNSNGIAGDVTLTQAPVPDSELPTELVSAARLPAGVSIVLRVICQERDLHTSHMHRT